MRRVLVLTILFVLPATLALTDTISVHATTQDACVTWGVGKLTAAIEARGGDVRGDIEVSVAPSHDALPETARKPEGFALSRDGEQVRVIGYDAPGAMYGCLELARCITEAKGLPEKLDVADAPTMSLRGTCILLMKLGLYDYPVTPKEFPFFYDKALWTEYLDFLAENRFNYIAFWNGHPFDYFVKLDKYPEAQDGLEPGLLERNHDMLMWLGQEAQKRNIWLMFEFYNIHVSVYFAKAHQLPEHGIDTPTPLLEDYTGYCVERFVNEFPSVGLYICPGEALEMKYTPDWINNVIFGAVKRTGKTPPIMVRSWGIDLEHMKQVVGNYPRLYTERKFNVEMIADTRIDPENADWAKLSGNHVVNIHCAANLEPFRWSPPSYIQKCVQSSLEIGATGLHLYPRKAWRWPYGCDKVDKPELQWHRDWMWFETWGRYAWNANRNPKDEKAYWTKRLQEHFGPAAGAPMLGSMEVGADILPSIQRLLWIGNDNHTVVAAGATLEQIAKAPGIPFLDACKMMRVPGYITNRGVGNPYLQDGTEPGIEVMDAEKAASWAEDAARRATRNKEEALRVTADARAQHQLASFYDAKIYAAAFKSWLNHRKEDRKLAQNCLKALLRSLTAYGKLTKLTSLTYESISDVPAWNPARELLCPYHWRDTLPLYEAEYARVVKELQARFPGLEVETESTPLPEIRDLEDYLLWSPGPGALSSDNVILMLVHLYQKRLPRIDSAELWRQRKEETQKGLLASYGFEPMPAKTPLNARTSGTVEYPDYTLEKIVYEAWPGIPVSAHLYLPKNATGPLPCVLYTCGHWYNGKTEKDPRSFCVGMVRNGIAVLIYDPMGQGERFAKDEHGHMFPILVGLSQEGFMVWESMRAIDYLETRKEIDPKRIGMTGASGGGLNTVFTAAIEGRLAAVAPVCYPVTYDDFMRAMCGRNWNGGVDLCNQVPGIITYADTSDLMACVAPRPQCQISATQDLNFPIDGARDTAAKVKAAYDAVAPGQFSFVEVDAPHGYDKTMREAAYGFFLKALARKGDGSPVPEAPVALDPWDDPKLKCFPDGQNHVSGPLLESLIRSAHFPAVDSNTRVTGEAIRQACCVPKSSVAPRDTNSGPNAEWIVLWRALHESPLLKEQVAARRFRWSGNSQILEKEMPASSGAVITLLAWAEEGDAGPSDYPGIFTKSKASKLNVYMPQFARLERARDSYFESSTDRWMLGRTQVGEDIADLEAIFSRVKEDEKGRKVVVFSGKIAAETALLAAACIPGIDGVVVDGPLITYRDLINCKVRWDASVYIPSVLKHFDLPQAIAAIAPRKVVLMNPVNGFKEPYDEAAATRILEPAIRAYREAGAADSFKILFNVADDAKAGIVCEAAGAP